MNKLGTILERRGAVILDGGLATHLESLGFSLGGPLWSARALLEAPDLVVTAHRDFACAGADVLSTVTYQLSSGGLQRVGRRDALADLFRRSVALAREGAQEGVYKSAEEGVQKGVEEGVEAARSKRAEGPSDARSVAAERVLSDSGSACEVPIVALSLGPYGAVTGDGAEYTGQYDLDRRGLRAFHEPRLIAAGESGADAILFETIPSGPEIEVLGELVGSSRFRPGVLTGLPFGLSLSTGEPGRLADGTPFAEITEPLSNPAWSWVGVNCLAPSRVLAQLRALREVTALPLAAYANRGQSYSPTLGFYGSVETFDEYVESWWHAGARVLGGCCGTTPQDIRRLTNTVRGLVRREA